MSVPKSLLHLMTSCKPKVSEKLVKIKKSFKSINSRSKTLKPPAIQATLHTFKKHMQLLQKTTIS